MSGFKPGDKVVCINSIGHEHKLQLGKIYTILIIPIYPQGLVIIEEVEGEWYQTRFELATTNPCCEVEVGTPAKNKCECPIDVLMNQGCQCGGK